MQWAQLVVRRLNQHASTAISANAGSLLIWQHNEGPIAVLKLAKLIWLVAIVFRASVVIVAFFDWIWSGEQQWDAKSNHNTFKLEDNEWCYEWSDLAEHAKPVTRTRLYQPSSSAIAALQCEFPKEVSDSTCLTDASWSKPVRSPTHHASSQQPRLLRFKSGRETQPA